MPKPTKQQTALLKRYRHKIDTARKYRRDEGLPDLWERMIDLYRGKHWSYQDSERDLMTINHAKALIDVIVPSVAVSNPGITVNARKPEMVDSAVVVETAANYEWRHRKFTPVAMSVVKDGLICGVGWAKAGWRFVEEWVDDVEAYEKTIDAKYGEIEAFAVANPDLAGDLPTRDDIARGLDIPKQSKVKADHPYLERVSVFDVFVDPDATTIMDAQWLAQKVRKPIVEVRVNESYDLWARVNVGADVRERDDWARGDDNVTLEDRQQATIWEFYDLKLGTMCVFSEAGEGFLVAPRKQPYAFGHPFIPYVDYTVPDRFYGMGELEAVEPLQHELNFTRTAIYNDGKAQRRRWLIDPKRFDNAGRAALESDQDGVAIPVTGGGDLGNAIIPIPSQPLNPQMYQNGGLIAQDIADVSGVTEYQRGGTSEIRRTATEASIIQDSANSRAAEKTANVEAFLAEVASKLVMLMQQYATGEQVARYTGANGQPMWVSYDPEWIQGEYDFEVEAGSTQPKNDTARRQAATQMMQALGPFMVPGGPVNTQAVLAHILKVGFQVADPQSFLSAPQSTLGEGPPTQDPNVQAPPQDAPPQAGPPQGGPVMQEAGTPDGLGASQGGPIPDAHTGGGVPPEILAQLQGQVGLPALPTLG